jgi:secreted PhoX family phosphatase
VKLSRRRFLGLGAATTASLAISQSVEALFARAARGGPLSAAGYGPLVADPKGLLDLPAGFQYRVFSTARVDAENDPRFTQRLTNGELVPPLHDGMGAFRGPAGVTVLVRNHEVDLKQKPMLDPSRRRPYDPLAGGGTTTLWVDADRKLVRAFPSVSGTVRNCAGGVTPWGSWLTCEEAVCMPGEASATNRDATPLVSKRHGYVFEVDSRSEGLVDPVPIVPMGRFRHEAAAVDPATGFVYLSEDRSDGLLYRYRPDVVMKQGRAAARLGVGDLAKGGTLEALRIVERPAARTQNYAAGPDAFVPGRRWRVDWVAIPNPDPDVDMETDPTDTAADPSARRERVAASATRAQGFARGAAQFARTEGVTMKHRVLHLCCTDGGPKRLGQVWRLDVASQELSLLVEPNDQAVLDGPDNLTPAPNGDLIVCEDGIDVDFLVGITPRGRLYHLARNAYNDIEFAGACFAPDGRTLFVNIQDPGMTFAIWGPWARRRD